MSNQASVRLNRNTGKIMRLWEERARKEIAASHQQEALALRNSLPEFLKLIAEALQTNIDRTEARKKADYLEHERVSRLHGRLRAGTLNYSMDQLVYEYHILRQTICDVMEEEEILSPVDREIIVAAVEQAVNHAATEFSQTLRDIQEKLSHTIAHDLRGPITAAKSSAELILRRPDDPDHCVRVASRIVGSMDQLDSMVRDLLDASRFRAGQELLLNFTECDLDLIARQVADEANHTYGYRVEVKSRKPCLGLWSESGLRRAIANLTTNAVKYGAADTLIIISVDQNEDTATVAVHNEGPPIPPEQFEILFQQFRRSRTVADKVGWGLGLTIVEGMAEAHHGQVRVESAAGKGTTFTMEIPKRWQSKAA